MIGLILRSVSGFYYVEDDSGTITECKARGSFRSNGISPKVGDRVEFSFTNEDKGVIEEIKERKNELTRPPISNIDSLYIVISTVAPMPNFQQIDELTVIAEREGIEPVIIISKNDLQDSPEIAQIYAQAGFKVFDAINDSEKIKASMAGKISAFAGNTGAGKSTLLNRIYSEANLKTGEISKKLGRGRHTTRVVELYRLDNGGYIADTPGFTTAQTEKYISVYKDDLPDCFRDFSEYKYGCRFIGCSHTGEKGCAVIEALNNGKIARSRYKSYVEIYNRIKSVQKWQIK